MPPKRKRPEDEERAILLKQQWHAEKNAHLKPFDEYKPGSGVKAWWKCDKSTCEHEHVWLGTIVGRFNGTVCPFCSNKIVCKCNSFVTKHPETAAMWDYSKNQKLHPEDYGSGSRVRAWFICKKMGCDHHKWEESILRVVKSGCPFCPAPDKVRKRVCPCTSLAATHPHIAKEWHADKNGDLKPDQVLAGSGLRVWWKCLQHKTCVKHEWQAIIADRRKANGTRCPFCHPYGSTPAICPCRNFAAVASPELLAEWHPENKPPTEYTPGSGQFVRWICKRDPSHPEWTATVGKRSEGYNQCPTCFQVQSYGERKIYEVIAKIFGSNGFLHNKGIPADLPALKEKNSLRLDFLICPTERTKNRYVVIEYDGEQHFPKNNFWTEGLARRDRLKNFWTVDNKIHLLRIAASGKLKIEAIIKRFLQRVEEATSTQTIMHLAGAEYDERYKQTMLPNE